MVSLLFKVQGFWGDIVCSPYFAIGIDSYDANKYAQGLYEILNKVLILLSCILYI